LDINHPDIKESDFIDKMTMAIGDNDDSGRKGLYLLEDSDIWTLLEKTGYRYGKIVQHGLHE
jgi:hypothetical protein